MGFAVFEMKKIGLEVDIPSTKLKTGAGSKICQVLNLLADKALEKSKFTFQMPRFKDQGGGAGGEELEIDDDGDNNMDMAENILDIVDDEEDFGSASAQEPNYDKQIIESKLDLKEWQLEVERVAPKLRMNYQKEGREWRAHYETVKQYTGQIKTLIPDCRARLERVSDDIGKLLEKIARREKNINDSLNNLGSEFKVKAEESKTIASKYNTLNEHVRQLADTYRQIADKHEQVQVSNSLRLMGSVSRFGLRVGQADGTREQRH